MKPYNQKAPDMPSPSIPNEYPIELTAPDITPYAKGNSGIPYVMTFDSGRSGAHVMISAIVHGNEICGPIALDWLLQNDVRPINGRLSLAFINVAAYENFDPQDPYTSRYVDHDFNRVWGEDFLASDKKLIELERAREIRPLLESVDLLLDIHSMQSKSPPMGISGMLAKGREIAQKIGVPELVVADAGHAEGTRMRDFGAFADPDSKKAALLVECGQHWEAAAGDLAIEASLRMLRAYRVVEPSFGGEVGRGECPAQKFVEVTDAVTISSDNFTFVQKFIGGEVLEKQGTLIGHDDDEPVYSPYDNCILIMPTKRTYKGQTAVRLGRFITG